jgi:ribosomal protein S27AE
MSDSRYELRKLVTVAVYTFSWEAQVAKARLASEGIHSIIADENVIRMVALSNAIGGVQVQVREQDAAAAAEVLQRRAPLPEIFLVGKDEPASRRCPGCGAAELLAERGARRLLGLLSIPSQRFRCGACGAVWKPDELQEDRPDEGVPAEGASWPAARRTADDEEEAMGLDAPLVTVARFHTPWEAHLAKTLLESEGVEACVLEERLPAVNLLSSEPLALNRLEVHRADAALAAELLSRAWNPARPQAVPDPDDQ